MPGAFPPAELDLENPLSDEASVMRTSMVPGMFNMLAYNLNRGTDNVRLFEAGNVFEASGGGDAAGNEAHLDRRDRELGWGCGAWTGSGGGGASVSVYDLKGDIETLLSPFSH